MDAYLAEIRLFGGNYAPAKWMFCDGSLLQISGYDTLFTIFGTTFGGDGVSTFALPDLRGRVPIGVGTLQGDTYDLGVVGGVTDVTVTSANMPSHSHDVVASPADATTDSPAGMGLAKVTGVGCLLYADQTPSLALAVGTVGLQGGGSQSHTNMQPYIAMNYIICVQGTYPPRQ